MNLPSTTITITREQARLLYELIQGDIKASQRRMRIVPDMREVFRRRIVLGQRLREQIPECYWR